VAQACRVARYATALESALDFENGGGDGALYGASIADQQIALLDLSESRGWIPRVQGPLARSRDFAAARLYAPMFFVIQSLVVDVGCGVRLCSRGRHMAGAMLLAPARTGE